MAAQSPAGKLSKEDLKKIGKGLMIAVGGAILTYATETLASIDFGQFTAIVTAAAAVLINAGWKLLKGK
jgi:hypothetical protein